MMTQAAIDELIARLRVEIPGLRIVDKDTDPTMLRIDKVVGFFPRLVGKTSAFLTRPMAFRKTIYVPSAVRLDLPKFFEVLCHEATHIIQQEHRWWRWLFWYFSPQIWVVATLLAVLAAFVGPWGLLPLAALLAALPWPSPWRLAAEAEAFAVSLCAWSWLGFHPQPMFKWYGGILSGMPYYRAARTLNSAYDALERFLRKLEQDSKSAGAIVLRLAGDVLHAHKLFPARVIPVVRPA